MAGFFIALGFLLLVALVEECSLEQRGGLRGNGDREL